MPLAWGIQVSANYQNKGPISLPASASFSNSQIAPSLGRDLAACGSRTGAACTARPMVNVVLPDTNYFEPRFHQLDLRFSRVFRLGGGATIQPQVDFFNVLNTNSVLGVISRLGPAYNVPIQRAGPAGGQIRYQHELLRRRTIDRSATPIKRPAAMAAVQIT